jgi:hypothetical protein
VHAVVHAIVLPVRREANRRRGWREASLGGAGFVTTTKAVPTVPAAPAQCNVAHIATVHAAIDCLRAALAVRMKPTCRRRASAQWIHSCAQALSSPRQRRSGTVTSESVVIRPAHDRRSEFDFTLISATDQNSHDDLPRIAT